MNTAPWKDPKILASAAGPQAAQMKAIFDRAAGIDIDTSNRLCNAIKDYGQSMIAGAPPHVTIEDLYEVAYVVALEALMSAKRVDALNALLEAWSNMALVVGAELFLEMYRHGRPNAQAPSRDALDRAAVAAAASFHAPVRYALIAVAARDLIGASEFDEQHYDVLTTPWARVCGLPHPEDADFPDA